jgi:hypothetical protein
MYSDNSEEQQNDLLQPHRRHSRLTPLEDKGSTFALRQWLNGGFLLLAVAGMGLWFTQYREWAVYLLIAAVALKFVELTLRIMRI